MDTLIKKILLENGLSISVFDHTYRYYGDFHLVKLEVICTVELTEDMFESKEEFFLARKLLGEKAVYRRVLEQMAVLSTAIGQAQETLIQHFKNHSLPYFSLQSFPKQFVLSQYLKAKKKSCRSAA